MSGCIVMTKTLVLIDLLIRETKEQFPLPTLGMLQKNWQRK